MTQQATPTTLAAAVQGDVTRAAASAVDGAKSSARQSLSQTFNAYLRGYPGGTPDTFLAWCKDQLSAPP